MGRPERALDRLAAVAGSGADLVTLWREAGPLLGEVVPHFEAPCFFTVDPASLLTTSHFQEGLPEIPAEWLGREYAEDDYNSMSEVLLSAAGVGTLHQATGGRPELSRKFHEEMQPFGCEQELLVALRTADGERWGLVGLYREQGRPPFSDQEIAAVRRVAPRLAAGARHGLLLGQALEPDLPDPPGLVVLDERLAVDSASPAAVRWLAALGGTVELPPPTVLAVAGRALGGTTGPVESRVRTLDGGWAVLRGARLDRRDGGRQASVIVEPAQPAHLVPLLLRAYGLTPREREVTLGVLRGRSTQQLADDLGMAPGTVQAHLRSIFDKTGVRSRRELVGRVFHHHYEPRVRDNERRTTDDLPSRHGPMADRCGLAPGDAHPVVGVDRDLDHRAGVEGAGVEGAGVCLHPGEDRHGSLQGVGVEHDQHGLAGVGVGDLAEHLARPGHVVGPRGGLGLGRRRLARPDPQALREGARRGAGRLVAAPDVGDPASGDALREGRGPGDRAGGDQQEGGGALQRGHPTTVGRTAGSDSGPCSG